MIRGALKVTHMKVIETKAALHDALEKVRTRRQTIGFVPTMGFLHEGHLSLMRRARQENDVVVASVFVNPTQFGPNEDLEAYPRDAQRDMDLMRTAKVDMAYFPDAAQLYPEGFTTYVEVQGPMTGVLCGASRPSHFQGVTTIVTKLFHLVVPDRAYFGQKDAQQVAVIQQMVRDLDFGLEVVVCPTVREPDGLAMSSRNSKLSPRQRADAVVLSQALLAAKKMIAGGEHDAGVVAHQIKTHINTVEDAVIDYVALVNAQTLANADTLSGEILIAVAVKLGKTRLIDNIRVEV
jgi:pantoate--beta-alanine ligase